jgi:hypothetical protein
MADLLCQFLNCECIFFRSEVIRLFRVGWNFPFTGLILGVVEEFRPLTCLHSNETPKGIFLRQTVSFEPLSMSVRRSVRPVREPKSQKKIKQRKARET